MHAAEVGLERIGKRFGDHWAVHDVTLQIGRGQFFTLLGPSGCGKTTLLRAIAGFVVPDAGTVYLDGQAVNHVPAWRRDVGMVFQSYALWPHLSVFENVAFGLRERKVRRADIERRVLAALAQVDLAGTERRRPSQLSGGQQQRVALARTLVIQPRVLLLDEPLSNLDAKLRVEMRLELLKLQREIGLTTVYVTHDQEEALAMSTRVAVMKDGRVVQEGTPREIYEQPVNDFVSAFVGQTNLFYGTVVRVLDELLEVDVGKGRMLRAAVPDSVPLRADDAVSLSVRPEAVTLQRDPALTSGANQISGRIGAAVYQGSSIDYEVLADGDVIRARVINPKGTPLFELGTPVSALFSARDVSVLRA